jgi:hypothetical protein
MRLINDGNGAGAALGPRNCCSLRCSAQLVGDPTDGVDEEGMVEGNDKSGVVDHESIVASRRDRRVSTP